MAKRLANKSWTVDGSEYEVAGYDTAGQSADAVAKELGLTILSRGDRVPRSDVKALIGVWPAVERVKFAVPALVGDERQVKAARRERARVLDEVRQALADLLPAARAEKLAVVNAELARRTSAQWWQRQCEAKPWLELCK